MIRVDCAQVWGFEHAIHGMRNPMNSWERSDSKYDHKYPADCELGGNDLKLMQQLYKGGTEHRKFMRQIFVSMDITAPLYWWKEADTYKVGTTANSCSTMHKLMAKPFCLSDFSHEHLLEPSIHELSNLISGLNEYREAWIQASNPEWRKTLWWQVIQLLPESYNQMRTVTMNYEVAATTIRQRRDHKLDEWRKFVETLEEELPYLREIMGGGR